jgi:hypothetical protein
MWEMIGKVLTGNNATPIIIFLLIFTILFIFSVKKRIISINKGGVRIGSDERELTIVRNQTQWAHLFLLSLKGKLITMEDPIREDYFADLVLEKIYDKVVEWITYNHINDKKTYIEIKQSEVKCIVYALPIQEQYKTPEFESRMNEWTKEIIMNLINIRKEYSI